MGKWDEYAYGNHRAVIRVTKESDAVRVRIPWRRRDRDPEKKNIILIDAQTGKRIDNLYRADVNREFGDLVFQPRSVPGDYYVYYLPNVMTGRSYPKVQYPEPENTCEGQWTRRHGLSGAGGRSKGTGRLSERVWNRLPEARVLEIQSIDEFNSVFPMEVIATAEETKALLARAPEASYLLFPEDRNHAIRMTDDLPLRWIERGLRDSFEGEACRGEFYAFQIGVYAFKNAIGDLQVRFTALKTADGESEIPASALRCFNTGGVDWKGEEFRKTCSVGDGKIRALWCGVQVPVDTRPGKYGGEVVVSPQGMEPSRIGLVLNVKDVVLKDAGDGEPNRLSRLRWLDSRIAFDDDVVAPFTPLEVRGRTVSCLGRTVTIGKNGFPQRIRSRFSPEATHLVEERVDVLAAPIELEVKSTDGISLPWKVQEFKITNRTDGAVAWESRSAAGAVAMDCRARMEFDGYLEFVVRVTARKKTSMEDIRLRVPVSRDAATYMMGMGRKGGLRPERHDWKWDQTKNQDSVWLGAVNAGIQCSFRDENYSRPLNTNFYLLKPLVMPRSWCNGGKGGCTIEETDDHTVTIAMYSGSRAMEAGEELYYNFNLLLTPFKPIDTKSHWSTRFFHSYRPIDEIAETGATTINNHHATEINPYINYPFLRAEEMRDYVNEAHEKGMKVKIYYTVRELSNRAPELFALRSLDHEILTDGPGGGFSWLQEHLGSNYIAAWFVRRYKDAAVINSGMSRWHNFYLEGLNWLVRNVGIDGVYIDDVAFDRTTMKRLRKILDRGREGALIDLHSANQYNERDGFVNSANLYLEHFPYIDRLWFGEYFEYDLGPDYWLVEVSGVPFGLMGEMLQDGGNPWRGMVYGMTARLPRREMPARLWKVWDAFGIGESRMMGYWSPACPVGTDHERVLATAYVKRDEVMIALASWAEERAEVRLDIHWKDLGLDPDHSRLTAPPIDNFQEAASFAPTDGIPVEPGKGWLLILHSKE